MNSKLFLALLVISTTSTPLSALAAQPSAFGSHAKIEVREIPIDGSGDNQEVVFIDDTAYATYQAWYAEDVPANLGPLNFIWGSAKKPAARDALELCKNQKGHDCWVAVVRNEGCYTFPINPVDKLNATNCAATAYAIDAANPTTLISERTSDGPQY